MSLAIGKYFYAFIWTEIPISDQVTSRVNYLATKEKQPEMNKGYPIFEWIPGVLITYKDDETQSEADEISSTHEEEHNYEITENGEEEESTKE